MATEEDSADERRKRNREKMRRLRAAKPEQYRAYARDSERRARERDPEGYLAHRAAKTRARRQRDRDRVRAEDRAHYRRNVEYNRAVQRLANQKKKTLEPERFTADNRRWREKRIAADVALHRSKCMAHWNNRRARLVHAPGCGVTPTQWRQVLVESLGICAYCNQPCSEMTMDHVEPLVLGGAHDTDNIVAACGVCNKSKGATPLLVWLAKRSALKTRVYWHWFRMIA